MSADRGAFIEMGRHSDLVGIGYEDLLLALQEAQGREVPVSVTVLAAQFLAKYRQVQFVG